jgi:hypothetical protein
LSKILKLNSYGYGADSEEYIFDSIQIGYGALGSYYFKKNPSEAIIVGSCPNINLIGSGFNGALIGRMRQGLGAYWHGVSIIKSPNKNTYLKKVPLIVRRPEPPSKITVINNVTGIKYEYNRWEISTFNKCGEKEIFFCKRLTLAAGPVENVRLLSSFMQIDSNFDDHFSFFAGTIETKTAIKKKLINKFGPFLLRSEILYPKEDNFICDIRPIKNMSEYNDNIYSNNTISIIIKLIKDFNLSKINEAFFNKFGISFYTKRCSVHIQALEKKSINIICNNSKIIKIIKKTPDINPIIKSLKFHLKEIKIKNPINITETHHITGATNIYFSLPISNLRKIGILKIIGSPTDFELTSKHHTNELRKHFE